MLSRFGPAPRAPATRGGATLATVPAAAQSASEERRFADAQARFDREYQLFRQAVDRYQASRQGAYPAQGYPNGGYPAPAYPAPAYNGGSNGGYDGRYAPPPASAGWRRWGSTPMPTTPASTASAARPIAASPTTAARSA